NASVPQLKRIAQPEGLLRCRISTGLMSALGQSRPVDTPAAVAPCPLRSKSGHSIPRCAMSAKCQQPTSSSAARRTDTMDERDDRSGECQTCAKLSADHD